MNYSMPVVGATYFFPGSGSFSHCAYSFTTPYLPNSFSNSSVKSFVPEKTISVPFLYFTEKPTNLYPCL